MNIVIEEIVNNITLNIDEVVSTYTIEVSEMQVPGADGKSAYQSAIDGGFVGTELEFNEILASQSGVNTGDETASTIINKIGDGSKINQSYLPSYVDDILEFDTVVLFPLVGELGKIYIVTSGVDINKQYRWTGSIYSQITNGFIASTNDVPDSVNKRYQTDNQKLFNDATSSIQSQLNSKANNSDVVKNIIVDTTTGTPITGTTAETVLFSALIPANSFKNGGFFNIKIARAGKIGTAGTFRTKLRISITNDVSLSTQLSDNLASTANISLTQERSFSIDNNNLKGLAPSVLASSDIANSTVSISSYAFNPAIDNYIFLTGQLSNLADSMFFSSILITN